MTAPRRASARSVQDGLVTNLVGAGLVVAVGAVVGGGGALLGLLLAGRPQAWGAALGAGLVTAFYLFGTVTVSLVTAYAPRASLLVAMLTYVLQVGALALVLARVQASSASGRTLDVAWVGGAVVVATVAWLVVLVVRAVRSVPDAPKADPKTDPLSEERVRG